MSKIMRLLSLLSLLVLAACGGGGDCEKTGKVSFVYTGETFVGTDPTHILTYRLGQANTWMLDIKGVTAGCLNGLKVVTRSAAEALPPGFTLDAATGSITTGVLVNHVEGRCTNISTGGTVGPSVNRLCPAGQTFSDVWRVLQISSNHIDSGNPGNTVLVFRPQTP